MGCSSVLLETNGDFEPAGQTLSYILCGSPACVGNLWKVTSKDLDIETKFLLENMVNEENAILLNFVHQARNQTKLKYLNGAALIYYGLPNVFVASKPSAVTAGGSGASSAAATKPGLKPSLSSSRPALSTRK